MASAVRVTFAPSGAQAVVEPGETLLDAAALAGVVLPAPCGGRGACGRCAVTVENGRLAAPAETEIRALARGKDEPGGLRLACMARVEVPVTVRSIVSPSRHPVDGAAVAGTGERVVAGVDLGTTTVGALLVDSVGGGYLGGTRVPNLQAAFGTDVLSRIAAAMSGSTDDLQKAAVSSILEALDFAADISGIPGARLERIAIAGNTAMSSLLIGVDVSGLAAHPFHHRLEGATAVETGLLSETLPETKILVTPPVAAFVGGDLLAGLIAEGLAEGSSGVIYIDLGTNAEVAASVRDSVVAASAAAGPAFEGWGIACGGSAGEGAVVRFATDGTSVLHPVTESGSPTRLTGSGLVSALAALRKLGHLGRDGALISEGPARNRFFETEGVLAVSLASDPLDRSLFVTQLDVRELQSAKAAVRVATERVLRDARMCVRDIQEVVLTGAFGGSLDSEDLVDLGVLPTQTSGVVRIAEDAALRGAAAIAFDPDLLEIAGGLARRIRHVDLALGETFAEEFMDATSFEPYEL